MEKVLRLWEEDKNLEEVVWVLLVFMEDNIVGKKMKIRRR